MTNAIREKVHRPPNSEGRHFSWVLLAKISNLCKFQYCKHKIFLDMNLFTHTIANGNSIFEY